MHEGRQCTLPRVQEQREKTFPGANEESKKQCGSLQPSVPCPSLRGLAPASHSASLLSSPHGCLPPSLTHSGSGPGHQRCPMQELILGPRPPAPAALFDTLSSPRGVTPTPRLPSWPAGCFFSVSFPCSSIPPFLPASWAQKTILCQHLSNS